MATQPNQALPNGYRLNEYTIVRKIGSGGFSMVYLATDDQNNLYAVKEYLPGALVLRTAGSVVVEASTEDNRNIFRHGMKCFFEEGRTPRFRCRRPPLAGRCRHRPGALGGTADRPGQGQGPWGELLIDPASGRTSHPKVFAGGDCQRGADLAVTAALDGRRAALAITDQLLG